MYQGMILPSGALPLYIACFETTPYRATGQCLQLSDKDIPTAPTPSTVMKGTRCMGEIGATFDHHLHLNYHTFLPSHYPYRFNVMKNFTCYYYLKRIIKCVFILCMNEMVCILLDRHECVHNMHTHPYTYILIYIYIFFFFL